VEENRKQHTQAGIAEHSKIMKGSCLHMMDIKKSSPVILSYSITIIRLMNIKRCLHFISQCQPAETPQLLVL
jgi:hypothetical protein